MCSNGTDDVLARILTADVDEDVMQALSARERRYVLYHLLDHERITLAELADVVAGWLAVNEQRVTTTVDRESIRLALYHNHLPKLAAIDLIAFDPEEKVVDRSPLTEPEYDLIEAAYLAEHRTDDTTK